MRAVTLDTNIYVSALNFGGVAARLLGMAREGEIRIDVSDDIITELCRVLREDFAWDGYRLHFMKENLLKITNRVKPRSIPRVVVDPDDDRILECAVEAGSEFVVTNDNDLLRLGEFEGIAIVNLAAFLELQARSW